MQPGSLTLLATRLGRSRLRTVATRPISRLAMALVAWPTWPWRPGRESGVQFTRIPKDSGGLITRSLSNCCEATSRWCVVLAAHWLHYGATHANSIKSATWVASTRSVQAVQARVGMHETVHEMTAISASAWDWWSVHLHKSTELSPVAIRRLEFGTQRSKVQILSARLDAIAYTTRGYAIIAQLLVSFLRPA